MNLTSALLRAVPISVAAALVVAALIAMARWRNRPLAARFEHALWLCVLAAMLAFAVPRITVYAGPPITRATIAQTAAATMSAATPYHSPAALIQSPVRTAPVTMDWSVIWTGVWATGAALMILRILVGVVLTRRSLAGAHSILGESAIQCLIGGHGDAIRGVDESDNAVVPMTIGWPGARIVLPAAWRTWTEKTVRAVMLHELGHVRRRDTLVTMLAAINKAIFWFHPLAWWLERRLSELAEFAADDAAVHTPQEWIEPQDYAAALVSIASVARPVRLRLSSSAGSVDFAQNGVHRIHRRLDRLFDSGARFGSGRIVWVAASSIALLSLVQFERPVRAQEPPAQSGVTAPDSRQHHVDNSIKWLEEPDLRKAEMPRREAGQLRVETSQATHEQKRQHLDDAMKKLEEMARRQQDLAGQQRADPRQMAQQRWQAEMLQREAFAQLQQVQHDVQDLSNSASAAQQASHAASDAQNVALEVVFATLQKLRSMLSVLAEKEATQTTQDLAKTAGQLAERQQEFERQLRSNFGNGEGDRKIADQLADQQAEMIEVYDQLRKAIEDAISRSASQQGLVKQLQDAITQAQQNEIANRMRMSEQLLRQGMGQYGALRAGPVTQALNQLRDALKNAQQPLVDAPNR